MTSYAHTPPHTSDNTVAPEVISYDIDRLEAMIGRFGAPGRDKESRRYLAEQIVEVLQMNELLNELRCLRNRSLSPCPDPVGHTHAREA